MSTPTNPLISPQAFSSVSEGGLLIARQIADAYRSYPAARVFLVGGSVSRGCADGYSDLEIGVFWEGDVPTKERHDAITRLDGELWTMDRDGRRMEHFGLYATEVGGGSVQGRCMVSMNHNTVAEMEKALDAVLNQWNTNAELQELIFAVQYAVILHGGALVSDWQARAAAFPNELAAKIVQENLSFGAWFIPESYIARNDFLVLYRHFFLVEQHLVRLLFGLNRLYLPSSDFKWLEASIESMSIVPDRLPERLRAAFQTADLDTAWRDLKSLILETLDLIDVHLPLVNARSFIPNRPEINTDWARQNWNPASPYTLMHRAGQAKGN